MNVSHGLIPSTLSSPSDNSDKSCLGDDPTPAASAPLLARPWPHIDAFHFSFRHDRRRFLDARAGLLR